MANDVVAELPSECNANAPEVFDSRALALLNRLASRKKDPTPPPGRPNAAPILQTASDGRSALVSQMKSTGAAASSDRSGAFAPFSIIQAPVSNPKPPHSPSSRALAAGPRPVTAGEQISNSNLRPFTASASAHGRDAAIAFREIASAAPYNRGMSGSALRAGAALGPDVSPAVLRVPRDETAAAPQTRVDHMVARLGAGLAAGSAAFAGPAPTAFARSFASPGSAGRTPSASNRPPEDAPPMSIIPSAAGPDSIYLVESLTQPGTFTCHRSREDKSANPERLSIDNRQLVACPVLEGEERLRLLNYQNNNIQTISNVSNLPNLIFLDLYNNSIKSLTGLQSVAQLRVLMLGKNKISKLEGLERLAHLDVLDLHSNRISRIEGLVTLTELRVLNLAGNNISAVEGLDFLAALTELNLRRNMISVVKSVGHLTALSRLFLSSNQISNFESIRNLLSSRSIVDLALESNPLCEDSSYRIHFVEHMKQLKVLDLRKVTDDERRQASAIVRKEEAKAAELQRREGLNEERSALHSTIESEFVEEIALGRRGGAVTEVNAKKLKGFVEEVSTADGPGIIAHGRAWEMLEKHVNVSNVPRQAASLLRLQSLTSLTCLTLKRCAIETIAQLLPLQYLTTLSKLNLPDNPVQTSPLLRPFLLWKMPNIGAVDGAKFSAQDIKQSSLIFEPYSRQISDFYRDCVGSSSVSNVLLSSVHWQEQCAPFTHVSQIPDCARHFHHLIRTKPPSKHPSNWEKSSAAAVAGVSSVIQAAMVFDTRIAALQKMWRDLPMECVKDGLFDADAVKLDVHVTT